MSAKPASAGLSRTESDRRGAVAVLDFETTGTRPSRGARVTEVGVVIVGGDGRLGERFQSLVNAGVPIPPVIERLTGISNTMRRRAPPPSEVIPRLAAFLRDTPVLAHNAAFDGRFLDDELRRAGCRGPRRPLLCSLLLARRLLPEQRRYGLGALVEQLDLPHDGTFHRALADATMTAHLWVRLRERLRERHGLQSLPLARLLELQRLPKGEAELFLRRHARRRSPAAELTYNNEF